ncbi:MAG TPA: hypothetical protein VGW98_10220 [Solirubrobacteraceae bacterium]|jgi:hypothetical protein|nr:hypothetical protein [Solirubrobacteraceae bacterium]
MPRVLYAERFLVAPQGEAPPEPDRYDEARAISLTAEGRPFIEAGKALGTRTFTEAEGESGDDDRDDTLSLVTETAAPGEPHDRSAHPSDAGSAETRDPSLGTKTMTFTDAEGSDDDRDRRRVTALGTDTRAEGERPDSPHRAHHDTAERAGSPEPGQWLHLTTVTKAAGERGT